MFELTQDPSEKEGQMKENPLGQRLMWSYWWGQGWWWRWCCWQWWRWWWCWQWCAEDIAKENLAIAKTSIATYILRIFCHHHDKTVDIFNNNTPHHKFVSTLFVTHLSTCPTRNLIFPSKGDIYFINLNSNSRFVILSCESTEGFLTMTNGNFLPFYTDLCLFVCLLKELGSQQAKLHWLHLFGFSPLCVFKCVFKLCS